MQELLMKCEVCLQLLEEYIDGELGEPEAAPVSAHLITCADCAGSFEALTSEQEVYSRYDRDLEIAPTMWHEVAARTTAAGHTIKAAPSFRFRELFALPKWPARPAVVWAFSGAMAILILVMTIGISYLRVNEVVRQPQAVAQRDEAKTPTSLSSAQASLLLKPNDLTQSTVVRQPEPIHKPAAIAKVALRTRTAVAEQSDVLFSDLAFSAVEERETQEHIENAQNLLRSVRNIEISEDNSDVDVSYEKAVSRRLLNENIVLRRDAEMRGKFPAKILLGDLEPFLIDIANLPDRPAADDLRVLKERVLKTEIVAALQGY
jgi:hypothetical protein